MRLKQIGSAGNKTRRYHERPNETSNTEVKETMKVAITAKRVVILMMTMALAGAMVACSGAAGTPGPAGPQGPKGDSGTPAETPEPGGMPTGEPGPVQVRNAIEDLVFHDIDGEMDTKSRVVMAAEHFFPTGLMYSLDDLTEDQMKRIDVGDGIDEATGMLTVMLKDKAGYKNDKLTVHATDSTSKQSISFHVRRNQAPIALAGSKMAGLLLDIDSAGGAINPIIWVGTREEREIKAKDVHAAAAGDRPTSGKDISLAINKPASDTMMAHFQDDIGNKLSLNFEGVSTKLTVTGGTMKVTLLGKKTTRGGSPPADTTIRFALIASDGHFDSADSAHVANVFVDAHPMIKEGMSIGTRRLEIESTRDTAAADTTMATIEQIGNMYFMDDRTPVASLRVMAWSEDPEIVKVRANEKNEAGKDLGPASTYDLVIDAMDRGETTVMVKVKEAKETTSDVDPPVTLAPYMATDLAYGANLGQESDVLSFKVIVE